MQSVQKINWRAPPAPPPRHYENSSNKWFMKFIEYFQRQKFQENAIKSYLPGCVGLCWWCRESDISIHCMFSFKVKFLTTQLTAHWTGPVKFASDISQPLIIRVMQEFCWHENILNSEKIFLTSRNYKSVGSSVCPSQPGPLSLVEDNGGLALIGGYHGVASPALLCHKDTAEGKGGFHAQKGSIIGRPYAIKTKVKGTK